MNTDEFDKLLEIGARRRLTDAEEARLIGFLDGDPSARTVWEEEMALSRLLRQLPDAPLSTNFTSQVLRSVDRGARKRPWRGLRVLGWMGLRNPIQQGAAAFSMVVLVALSTRHFQSRQREKMALSLASVANHLEKVSDVTSLTTVETWEDFDAIYRLAQTQPQADEQLLAVLEMTAQ